MTRYPTDMVESTAYVVRHRSRYWLARQQDDGRWIGEMANPLEGCRFGSVDYVCGYGVRSWASLSGARKALRGQGYEHVRVWE